MVVALRLVGGGRGAISVVRINHDSIMHVFNLNTEI